VNDIETSQLQGEMRVRSALGQMIKVLKIGWEHIVVKHPDLKDKFGELVQTIEKPEAVMTSKIDSAVHLYYRHTIEKKYFCAICRHYNGEGFLITAYYTYHIKGERKVWPTTT
jgi:hypothetical protein